jgi:hypothetical protein
MAANSVACLFGFVEGVLDGTFALTQHAEDRLPGELPEDEEHHQERDRHPEDEAEGELR